MAVADRRAATKVAMGDLHERGGGGSKQVRSQVATGLGGHLLAITSAASESSNY